MKFIVPKQFTGRRPWEALPVRRMQTGDIFHATAGTEHVAHPVGEARVLVVEHEGSIRESAR